MLQIRIGLKLSSLRLPLAAALRKAKELGAEAVEIDLRSELRQDDLSRTGIRQIRKWLDDLQLKVCAVDFPTRRGYNVVDGLDERVEATRRAMKLAFDLGASLVVNQVGIIPAEPQGASWELLVQVLSDLGRHGQRVGATLAAATGSESGTSLRRLIDALPLGSLGVDFNPGNLILNGYSPREELAAVAAFVLHLHASDGVRDLSRARGVEMPLGHGAAEFPELLGMLEEQHYRGYITIARDDADQPFVEINQALQYLRQF